MSIEVRLLERIEELETTLRYVRHQAAFNLESPGNEDDTLNYVVDSVTSVLHDNYEYVSEEY